MRQPGQQLGISNRWIAGGLMAASVFLWVSAAPGGNWPRFRGPNGQGISTDENIPVKWTESDHNWNVKLPGVGHSSPTVWAGKVFATCSDQKTGRCILLALRASDGDILWRQEYEMPTYRMNSLNSYAATTPALDAERIYALWPTTKETLMVALDHEGREIWRRTFAGYRCNHGPGGSAIVFDDIVAFTLEHEGDAGDTKSAWIALDSKTGRTKWQLPRQNSPKTSYSTPCIYRGKDSRAQLVFTSRAHGMTGVDPKTGEVIWEVNSAFPNRVVSSPVIADTLLFGTCGDGGTGKRLIAIRPGTAAEPARAQEAYKIEDRSAPYVPTSVARDALLFTFHDGGDVSCLRSATGETLWKEKPAGRYYGSPVWVDGRLYCITIEGEVVVIRAAPQYELLAVNPLGEKSHATPAVADGRMYLRTYSQLVSIGPAE